MGILAVLSKRQGDEIISKDYIKISKQEYDDLIKAKEELAKLKGK